MNSIGEKIIKLEDVSHKPGDSVVLCHGLFNIIHPGHIRYLNYAHKQAKKLVVSIQGDVHFLNSEYKLQFTETERAEGVASIQTVDNVIKDFKKIDILVNDAAYNIWIPFQNLKALTYKEWNKIININLTGPMLFIKAVAEPMKLQGAGRIVNIASVAGMAPVGSSIAYGVSKAGLIQLTKGMAVALASDNILVNCVSPGYLEGTRMSDNLAEEYKQQAKLGAVLKKAADKDDIADQVVTFCKTDTTTGQTIVIDAGRLFH